MMTKTRLYGLASAAIFIGIVIACLWPFGAPRNEVSWLKGGHGLRFGEYGTIVSRGPLLQSSDLAPDSWTLELWLRPGQPYQTGTILAFYAPQADRGFSLRQVNADLVADEHVWSRNLPVGDRTIAIDGAFQRRPLMFLTLRSGAGGTSISVNGKPIRMSPQLHLIRADFSGQLVLGTSPVENDAWSGDLQGLAFYDSELSSAEVFQHYASWAEEGRPDMTLTQTPAALFLFHEGSGSIVHNEVPSGTNLEISARYNEVHHAPLKRPWDEYRMDSDYWSSALTNVAGFVPLGFLLYGYLFLGLRRPRAALMTILVGCLLSLTVEILQSFLPTRDSGMTDIITNTAGTALGAALCRGTSVICAHLADSRFAHVRLLAGPFTPGQRETEPNWSAR